MAVTVKLRHLRIAPRKIRLVADIIRGQRVGEAETKLEFTRKKAAKPLRKLLHSAIVSAEHDFQLNKSDLFVSRIFVDEGPKIKRWRPAARGRSLPIQKKTSHITLVLDRVEKELESAKRLKGKKKLEESISSAGPLERQRKRRKKAEILKKQKMRPRAVFPKLKAPGRMKRIFRRKAF